jgi:TRAP transporter TAXI family solute receptor
MLVFVSTAHAKTEYLGLGTGEITGVYYQVGGAIAQIVNSQTDRHGLRIIVEPTGGSFYNLNAVEKGDLPLAMAQSDSQYRAINGLAGWADTGKQDKLRSMFSFYPESVTLIVREQSGIKKLSDLKHKRVNLGSPESGTYQNSLDVLQAAGINPKLDLQASNMKDSVAADMMVSGRIDALFITVGHPSKFVEQLLASLPKIILLPVTGMDKLLDSTPYYTRSVIPSQFYPALKESDNIESIGVRATLVTSVDVSDEIVYALTKEIFENFEQFKALHPVFSTLTISDMLEGCLAPFHNGAMKYYKQALMKK